MHNQTHTITQAMILAAGRGTRLSPLTLKTPKPLIKVGGQPLIVWHIKSLSAAGIKDIVINTSWLSDQLIDKIGDGSQYDVNIQWSVEEEPLETAGGIAKAIRDGYLRDDPFILINGDVWTDFDITPLVSYEMTPNQTAHLILVDNPKHNPNGDFAINNGLASESAIANAPKYTFSGISIIAPKLVRGIAKGQVAPLAALLKKEMIRFNVTAQLMQSSWVDVGTLERLQTANQLIESDGANLHKGRPDSRLINAQD